MSDGLLRNRERAAAQGGLDAEVKLLVERVRCGTLSRERLSLAAYCGSESARVLAPKPKWETLEGEDGWKGGYVLREREWEELDESPISFWSKGLPAVDVGEREKRCPQCDERTRCPEHGVKVVLTGRKLRLVGIRLVPWGSEWVLLRAAIVAAELALPVWEAAFHFKWDGESLIYVNSTEGVRAEDMGAKHRYAPRRAIQAAKDWLRLGTLEALEACMTAWHLLVQPVSLWVPHARENLAELRTTILASALSVGECRACKGGGANLWNRYEREDCNRCNGTGRINRDGKVRTAICADLVEWALAKGTE